MKIKLTFMIGMLSACTLLLQANRSMKKQPAQRLVDFSTNGLQKFPPNETFPDKAHD